MLDLSVHSEPDRHAVRPIWKWSAGYGGTAG